MTHNVTFLQEKKNKQEAHGPWLINLSDIATADMQMLCNIFPILIPIIAVLSFEEEYMGMTVNEACSSEQTLNHLSAGQG